MKISLTKAWEAHGFGGMILRWTVQNKLIDQLFRDPKKKEAAKFTIVFCLLGSFHVVIYMLLLTYLDEMMTINMALTVYFLFAVLYGMALVVGSVGISLSIYGLVRELRRIGYIDRYIFEHRDDEVEL